MRMLLAVAVGVALGGAAWAQGVSDSVTVTTEKERQAINGFVSKLSAPARLTGKLGRWDVGVCPVVLGIRPEFGRYIEQRVRDTAARVGAPVNASSRCRPNIHIVFTTTPQPLVTNIRRTQPYMLGYADSEANKDRLAMVKFPVQAWYSTKTRDKRGQTFFDSPKVTGFGNELRIPCGSINHPLCPGGYMVLPSAIGALGVTGGRLGDGVRSVFHNIIIVADPNALLEYEMGTLADHAAMLALAQTEPLKDCSALASILNLFTPGCAMPPTAMTVHDEGYLRGLYSMDAAGFLQTQRDQMVFKIGQTAQGR